jgi:hypothetical protein
LVGPFFADANSSQSVDDDSTAEAPSGDVRCAFFDPAEFFALADVIGFDAFVPVEALPRVWTNGIPRVVDISLTVGTVNVVGKTGATCLVANPELCHTPLNELKAKQLQTLLAELGYATGTNTADGWFGPKTAESVKSLQQVRQACWSTINLHLLLASRQQWFRAGMHFVTLKADGVEWGCFIAALVANHELCHISPNELKAMGLVVDAVAGAKTKHFLLQRMNALCSFVNIFVH